MEALECRECRLRFSTAAELGNHKEKFCKDSLYHDPTQLALSLHASERRAAAEKPLRLNDVQQYLLTGSADDSVGKLSLAELRTRLAEDGTEGQALAALVNRKRVADRVGEIKALQAKHARMRMQREQDEGQLMQQLKETEERKAAEYAARVEKERAVVALQGFERGKLKTIEQQKRQELDQLHAERQELERKEQAARDDLAKLTESVVAREKQHQLQYERQQALQLQREQAGGKLGEAESAELAMARETMQQHADSLASMRARRLQLQAELAALADGAEAGGGMIDTDQEMMKRVIQDVRSGQAQQQQRLQAMKRELAATQASVLTGADEDPQAILGSDEAAMPRDLLEEDAQGYLDSSDSDPDDVTGAGAKYASAIRQIDSQMTKDRWAISELVATAGAAASAAAAMGSAGASSGQSEAVVREQAKLQQEREALLRMRAELEQQAAAARQERRRERARRRAGGARAGQAGQEDEATGPASHRSMESDLPAPTGDGVEPVLDQPKSELLQRVAVIKQQVERAGDQASAEMRASVRHLERLAAAQTAQQGAASSANLPRAGARAASPMMRQHVSFAAPPVALPIDNAPGAGVDPTAHAAPPMMPMMPMMPGGGGMLGMSMPGTLGYDPASDEQMREIRQMREELEQLQRASQVDPAMQQLSQTVQALTKRMAALDSRNGITGGLSGNTVGGGGSSGGNADMADPLSDVMAALAADAMPGMESNPQLAKLHQQHIAQMAELGYEMRRMRAEMALNKLAKDAQIARLEQDLKLERAMMMEKRKREELRQQMDTKAQVPSVTNRAYRPATGFRVYLDILSGLPDSAQVGVLVSYCMFLGRKSVGAVTTLPMTKAQADPTLPGAAANLAVLAAKRSYERVNAAPGMRLVLEMKAAGAGGIAAGPTLAWTSYDVFDGHAALQTGLRRVPMFPPPVQPTQPLAKLMQRFPDRSTLYEDSHVLWLRVINAVDEDAHDGVVVASMLGANGVSKLCDAYPPPPPPSQAAVAPAVAESAAVAAPTRPVVNVSAPDHEPDMRRDPSMAKERHGSTRHVSINEASPIGTPRRLQQPGSMAAMPTASAMAARSSFSMAVADDVTEASSTSGVTSGFKSIASLETAVLRVSGPSAEEAAETQGGVRVQVMVFDADAQLLGSWLSREITGTSDALDGGAGLSSGDAFDQLHVASPAMAMGIVHLLPASASGSDADPILAVGDWDLYADDATTVQHGVADISMVEPPFGYTPGTDLDQDAGETVCATVQLRLAPGPSVAAKMAELEQEKAQADAAAAGPAVDADPWTLVKDVPIGAFRYTSEKQVQAIAAAAAQRDLWQAGNGYELYVDGARFLPDNATITRCMVKIYGMAKQMCNTTDIEATCDPHGDLYNPSFNIRYEHRKEKMDPTSTLVIKILTIDEQSNKLCVAGYAALPVFLDINTAEQPTSRHALDFVLNEGSFQLPLYSGNVRASEAGLTAACLEHNARIPCASVLVRLHETPKDPSGKLYTSKGHDTTLPYPAGLVIPAPAYASGEYDSRDCEPSEPQKQLYAARLRREPLSADQAMSKLGAKDVASMDDEAITSFLETQLSATGREGMLDTTFLAPYDPAIGFRVAVDAAHSLSISGVHFAMLSLVPPGDVYRSRDVTRSSHVRFVHHLDWQVSHGKSPVWNDGFLHLSGVLPSEALIAVVDVRSVAPAKGGVAKVEQAGFAVLPLLVHGKFIRSAAYQLPLYTSTRFSDVMTGLEGITSERGAYAVLSALLSKKIIRKAAGASVVVRLVDNYWDKDKLEDAEEAAAARNTMYIPDKEVKNYKITPAGKPVSTLVPKGVEKDAWLSSAEEAVRTDLRLSDPTVLS